ncbi:MAG TPA: hypothetical protein DCZ61_01140 [Lachnospiraceae bacterium]|nr:hypothetical protein [Lachnospiraceae bacterium]
MVPSGNKALKKERAGTRISVLCYSYFAMGRDTCQSFPAPRAVRTGFWGASYFHVDEEDGLMV